MSYKFARVENGEIKKHIFDSYVEAEEWVREELKKYVILNRVLDECEDRSYMRFKEQLEGALKAQDMKCKKCSEEDHEGDFCRCEDRNIRLAKEKRSQGKSPWKKNQVSKKG